MKNKERKPLKSCLQRGVFEAGCDEAGRGCLAGPVFAAAVILPDDFIHPLLNDSKQLSARERYQLRTEIEASSVAWAVAMVDNNKIDKINILNASILAMQNALDKLSQSPGHIIVDGNRFKPYQGVPFNCIVKGDATYFSIAAASVLAKTYRDDYMLGLHQEYGYYGWDQNKGYPTKFHREAIRKYGITKYHRLSFRLLEQQYSLDFGDNLKDREQDAFSAKGNNKEE
ncbi:MAG: ribonuclease HII [Bacteroidota bacterium]|nr:ribonuclease HII [Bacteroidota bacterium]MDP4226267.1 ribonuclease HII [Bacteroidota bacterium]MDP4274433.1 ribonuclease HII [Bacteroidota bacterium]